MALHLNDQDAIRQYLLRLLSDDGQREVEQRLLTEDDLFEEFEIAEDELVHEYLAGQLTEIERERFERSFLTTPERHANLQFASALKRYAARHTSDQGFTSDPSRWPLWKSRTWVFRAAAAVGVVAVIAGALWFFYGRTKSPQTFATLTLSISNNNRAEGAQADKVELPLGADALKIALKVPDGSGPAIRYRVEIADSNGESKTIPIAAQDSQSVFVTLSEKELRRGSYALKLFATSVDNTERRIAGSYFFDVE